MGLDTGLEILQKTRHATHTKRFISEGKHIYSCLIVVYQATLSRRNSI